MGNTNGVGEEKKKSRNLSREKLKHVTFSCSRSMKSKTTKESYPVPVHKQKVDYKARTSRKQKQKPSLKGIALCENS